MDAHDEQMTYWAEVLETPCPVCVAEAGQPCMPMSLRMPHMRRIDADMGLPVVATDGAQAVA